MWRASLRAAVRAAAPRRSASARAAQPAQPAGVRTGERRSAAALLPLSRTDAFTLNCELTCAESAEHVLSVVRDHARGLNVVNLTTALFRLHETTAALSLSERARLLGGRAPELRALADATERAAEELDARGLATIMYACARLDQPRTTALLLGLAPLAGRRLHELDGRGLSTAAWALAHSAKQQRARGRAAGAEEAAELPEPVRALLLRLGDECTGRCAELSAQGLANCAWAFATARVGAPSLFAAIEAAAVRQLGRFEPVGLSMLLWAFHAAGVRAPALLVEARPAVLRWLGAGELSPAQLVGALGAYAAEAEEGGEQGKLAGYAELLAALEAEAGASELLGAFEGAELGRLVGGLRPALAPSLLGGARADEQTGPGAEAQAESARVALRLLSRSARLLCGEEGAEGAAGRGMAVLRGQSLSALLGSFSSASAATHALAAQLDGAEGGGAEPLGSSPRWSPLRAECEGAMAACARLFSTAALLCTQRPLWLPSCDEPALVALIGAFGAESVRAERAERAAALRAGGAPPGCAEGRLQRVQLLHAAGQQLAARTAARAGAEPSAAPAASESPVKLLTVALAYARARQPPPDGLRAWLSGAACGSLCAFGPRELCLLARSAALCMPAEHSLFAALHASALERAALGELGLLERIDVAWALAQAAATPPSAPSASASASPSLRRLLRESALLSGLAAEADPWLLGGAQLVELLWAFKASGHAAAPALLRAALPAVCLAAPGLAPHELACLLYAYAALNPPGCAQLLFRPLAPVPPARQRRRRGAAETEQARAQAEEEEEEARAAQAAFEASPTAPEALRRFGPLQLSHLAVAFALADPHSAQTAALVARVADAAASRAGAASPGGSVPSAAPNVHDLSGHLSHDLSAAPNVHDLSGHLSHDLSAAPNVHDLSGLAWALAQAGVAHPQLLSAVSAQVSAGALWPSGAEVDAHTSSSLSRLLWACAEADGLSPLCERTRAMIPEVGRCLLPQLGRLSDVDAAKLALSLCAPSPRHDGSRAQLFAEIARGVRPRLGRFRPAALSLLARAFASARAHDGESAGLLAAIAREARGQLRGRYAPSDLVHLAWAAATARADGRCAGGFPEGAELLAEAHEALSARLALRESALDGLSQREAAQLVWAFGNEGLLQPGELASRLLGAVVLTAAERSAPAAQPQPARQLALLCIGPRREAAGARDTATVTTPLERRQ